MNDEIKKEPAPSVLDMLVDALALRIKDKIMEEIEQKIADSRQSIDADEVEGLTRFVESAFEEHMHNFTLSAKDVDGLDREVDLAIANAVDNGDIKISAEDVGDLDSFIKETMKEATIDISF